MNPIIIDSNIWILACATNQEDSPLDKQVKQHAPHGDADKIRGFIFRHLMDRNLIVPEAVTIEVNNFKKTSKAGPHNLDLLNRLTKIFQKMHSPVVPTRDDLVRQFAIFSLLKESKKTSQEYLTYQKISGTEKLLKEESNQAKALKEKGELGNWEKLALEIDRIKKEFERHPQAAKSLQEKRYSYERVRPLLIPDYEILLSVERSQGVICSRDADMLAWHESSPNFKSHCGLPIEPGFLPSDPEKSFGQLEAKIREKITRHNIPPLEP